MQDILERPGASSEAKERPAMHRVGTTKGRIENPKTLGERLVFRRLDLKLGQGAVAKQVRFFNDRQKIWSTLSRSAYCMYESGSVIPDIPKVIELAKALQCSPQWLAFGDGSLDKESEIEEVEWDHDSKDFVPKDVWNLSDNWLQDSVGLSAADLTLCKTQVASASLRPGYIAIVHKDEQPNASSSEYVFVEEGALMVAQVMQLGRGTTVRIFEPDMRSYRDASSENMTFLGRVVGHIAGKY